MGLHIQWGDVATWVGGLGTAFALFLTWRLLKITRDEQRTAQEEHRHAQARLVSAWCDHVGPISSNGLHTVTVKLQNSSDESIYGVIAAVGASWFGDKVQHEEINLIYVIPPKSIQQQDVSLQLGVALDGSYEPAPPVEVAFYDSTHERLWFRNRFGHLSQLTDEESKHITEQFFKKRAS